MIPGDLDAANAIFGDPDVMRYIPRPPVRPDEMPAYLERLNVITEHDPGLGLWPIVEKSSGAVVGDCGLVYIPSTMDVEIAWHLRRDAWGRGYITEAATAVLAYGFSELHMQKIYALIVPENARSVGVANRLGMRFDRVVRAYHRDVLRYKTSHSASGKSSKAL
jgi:ribosomal-protein-alanine N-acetyltransferase